MQKLYHQVMKAEAALNCCSLNIFAFCITHVTKCLFERSNDIIKNSGKEGKVSIGCEAAAAEGYVEYMPFNDARNYGFESGTPVPVYNYVFHEYINNYMGNCNTSYF